VRDALPVLDLLRLELVVLGRHAQQRLALVKEVRLRVAQRALKLADLVFARPPLEAHAIQLGVLRLRVAGRGRGGGGGRVSGGRARRAARVTPHAQT
jgi:hypothetical protein